MKAERGAVIRLATEVLANDRSQEQGRCGCEVPPGGVATVKTVVGRWAAYLLQNVGWEAHRLEGLQWVRDMVALRRDVV